MTEGTHADAIDGAMTQLVQAIDRERLAAEVAEKMKPFAAEWKYAPEAERRKAQAQIQDEQKERAGLALFALGQASASLEEVVAELEATEAEAPSALQAFALRASQGEQRQRGHTIQESTNLEILDELRLARVERQLANAKPSVVLAAYQRALKTDPWEQANATLIRYVEAQDRAGWTWPADASQSEADQLAVRTLPALIAQTRKNRYSAATRALRLKVEQAKNLEGLAVNLHKIRAQRVPSRPRDEARHAGVDL